VRADIRALRDDPAAGVQTAPARLAAGLWARHSAGAGPIAVVPCDNVPDNGSAVARVVRELAGEVSTEMQRAVEAAGSFVSTMVDRITPGTRDADRAAVTAATGWIDAAPVVTEPFSEWIMSGDFPAGRPDWEAAGARMVDDVAPFEQRKLWLLNGSHSLLAYCGSLLGHDTVDQASTDPDCRAWMQQWWDEAAAHLPLPAGEITQSRDALLRRYGNPRIGHLLVDIAADGSQKLPVRILPVLRAELAAGRIPTGACRVVAGWICHLRGAGMEIRDTAAEEFTARAAGPLPDAVRRVLDGLDPELAVRAEATHEIARLAAALQPLAAR
jgi:fructuronate reductase